MFLIHLKTSRLKFSRRKLWDIFWHFKYGLAKKIASRDSQKIIRFMNF